MNIRLKDLEAIFNRASEYLRQRGSESIEIPNIDYYWIVLAPEWTQMEKEPTPAVGSLSDDWKELTRTLDPSEAFTAVDLDRCASMLRALSEKLVPRS